jgi:hypothetical protein
MPVVLNWQQRFARQRMLNKESRKAGNSGMLARRPPQVELSACFHGRIS